MGETGRCILNRDINACPDRIRPTPEGEAATSGGEPNLETPDKTVALPSAQALGLDDVGSIMSNRYCRLVGVLGSPDAGKTAVLVSLYLLLAHGKCAGFKFADSESLMALDEISRGARHWNEGSTPGQLTTHTELQDDRVPGFIHLQLVDRAGQLQDLCIPDLPGEWSDSLIDKDRFDRLQFLHSADVIWLMIDGRQLTTAKKGSALHRAELMMQRLAQHLGARTPRLIAVISHLDSGAPDAKVVERLNSDAAHHGLTLKVLSVASFAGESAVRAGTGISELIAETLSGDERPAPSFWSDQSFASNAATRQMLRY